MHFSVHYHENGTIVKSFYSSYVNPHHLYGASKHLAHLRRFPMILISADATYASGDMDTRAVGHLRCTHPQDSSFNTSYSPCAHVLTTKFYMSGLQYVW